MIQALKAKEIDLAWGVPLSNIPELKALESQGITTLVQPGTGAERYAFNMDHTQVPLFADKELRQALSLSVDRKTIVDKLLFGLTTIARGDWDNTPWENTSSSPSSTIRSRRSRFWMDSAGSPVRTASVPKDGQKLAFDHTTTTGSSAARERPAAGPAELQGRRRGDEHQERAQHQLFGSYAAGGAWARGEYQMGGWSQGINLPDPDISSRYLTKEIASEQNPQGAQ